jgi:hypothetical protein
MKDLFGKSGIDYLEFDDKGRLVVIKGHCKAKDFKKAKQ